MLKTSKKAYRHQYYLAHRNRIRAVAHKYYMKHREHYQRLHKIERQKNLLKNASAHQVAVALHRPYSNQDHEIYVHNRKLFDEVGVLKKEPNVLITKIGTAYYILKVKHVWNSANIKQFKGKEN